MVLVDQVVMYSQVLDFDLIEVTGQTVVVV